MGQLFLAWREAGMVHGLLGLGQRHRRGRLYPNQRDRHVRPQLGRGGSNRGRYRNTSINVLTNKTLTTLGDGGHETLLWQGAAMAMAEHAFAPLHQLTNF